MASQELETMQAPISKFDSIQAEDKGLRYTSWLLVQIELELASVPEDVRTATVSEVEEHLRCSRLALEELGLPRSDAERESVTLFGSPKRFTRQVINSHKPKPKPQPALCLLTAATFLFLAVFPTFMYYNRTLAIDGLWCAVPAFIFLSWRARTFQWKALAKTGLLVGALFTLFTGFAWVSLTADGGLGESPRWDLADLKATSERQMILIPDAMNRCDPIARAFDKGEQFVRNSPYSTRAGYLEFQMLDAAYAPFMPNYRIAFNPDYALAARSWRIYGAERETLQAYLQIVPREAAACDHAASKLFDPIPASQGALGALFLTAVALILSFCVFVFRSVWDLTARRIKRTLA